MDTDAHIAALLRQTDWFAAELLTADLDTAVPTCPEWRVRDLAAHVGHLHRWATKIVDERIGTTTWPTRVEFPQPGDAADAAAWAGWLKAGAADACACFGRAEPARRVWAWGADQHARFWPRRMLFETVVHGADLCFATGRAFTVDVDTAIDGIDEHLANLRYVAQWQPSLAALVGSGERLRLDATDAGQTWRIRLAPTGWWWDRSTGDADAAVSGSSTDLMLWLQTRPAPQLERTGALEVIERWEAANAF